MLSAGVVLGGFYGNYSMSSRNKLGLATTSIMSTTSQTSTEAVKARTGMAFSKIMYNNATFPGMAEVGKGKDRCR
ncbi:MAG: hypothetical protein NVSMB38_22780 [Ktedonobacteraceae bacterium]